MKVLIVANYAKEHINKFHLSTIKRFKEMGWEVDVACKADAEIPGADQVFNLPIERNPYRPATFKAIKMLKKIIADGNYDAVHCHTYAGKFVGILAAKKFRKNGLKIIYSAHGFQYYKGAGLINWMIFMPIDKWLIKKVDLLITANKEDYNTAIKHKFKAANIVMCCGVGVKLDKFRANGKPRDEVRKEIDIPNDATLLIYVAELNKNKNQKMLIRMFDRIKDEMPNAHMILVGPDHYGGTIQNIIKEKNLEKKVYCLGWRSDVPDLIKASDIAVASSYREGFGLNIVEYQACGVPVVATANRGHREIIKDGITGFLVPFDDDELMSRKVLTICNDRDIKESIIKKASEEICEFEDETIVNKIIEFYKIYIIGES